MGTWYATNVLFLGGDLHPASTPASTFPGTSHSASMRQREERIVEQYNRLTTYIRAF